MSKKITVICKHACSTSQCVRCQLPKVFYTSQQKSIKYRQQCLFRHTDAEKVAKRRIQMDRQDCIEILGDIDCELHVTSNLIGALQNGQQCEV